MIAYRGDRQGTGQILRETFRDTVNANARAIAQNVRAAEPDAQVIVNYYTTDRSAATVTIADPRGRIWHVRDGIFTRAAAGMQIRLR